MKKEYTKPTIEVIKLEVEDIIRTSGTESFDLTGDADKTITWPW